MHRIRSSYPGHDVDLSRAYQVGWVHLRYPVSGPISMYTTQAEKAEDFSRFYQKKNKDFLGKISDLLSCLLSNEYTTWLIHQQKLKAWLLKVLFRHRRKKLKKQINVVVWNSKLPRCNYPKWNKAKTNNIPRIVVQSKCVVSRLSTNWTVQQKRNMQKHNKHATTNNTQTVAAQRWRDIQ